MRRQAQRMMREFDVFRDHLEALGIKVVIEPDPVTHPAPGGRTSDCNSVTADR